MSKLLISNRDRLNFKTLTGRFYRFRGTTPVEVHDDDVKELLNTGLFSVHPDDFKKQKDLKPDKEIRKKVVWPRKKRRRYKYL